VDYRHLQALVKRNVGAGRNRPAQIHPAPQSSAQCSSTVRRFAATNARSFTSGVTPVLLDPTVVFDEYVDIRGRLRHSKGTVHGAPRAAVYGPGEELSL
jgi:hypothetical protein